VFAVCIVDCGTQEFAIFSGPPAIAGIVQCAVPENDACIAGSRGFVDQRAALVKIFGVYVVAVMPIPQLRLSVRPRGVAARGVIPKGNGYAREGDPGQRPPSQESTYSAPQGLASRIPL
jgi:hypothetical protein